MSEEATTYREGQWAAARLFDAKNWHGLHRQLKANCALARQMDETTHALNALALSGLEGAYSYDMNTKESLPTVLEQVAHLVHVYSWIFVPLYERNPLGSGTSKAHLVMFDPSQPELIVHKSWRELRNQEELNAFIVEVLANASRKELRVITSAKDNIRTVGFEW